MLMLNSEAVLVISDSVSPGDRTMLMLNWHGCYVP